MRTRTLSKKRAVPKRNSQRSNDALSSSNLSPTTAQTDQIGSETVRDNTAAGQSSQSA